MDPIIKLEDFRRTYRDGSLEVHAVQGVSLDICPGEFVAVMGASGSGKSTMMNTIGCLDRPTSGRYLLDGVDVGRLNRDQLASLRNRKLGFVFQGFNLLARTSAIENVELPILYCLPRIPAREQYRRAREALEMVGLADKANCFPNQLSGGQQQRVSIARALVNQPRVVLADEPTGNLDTRTSIEVMGIFESLNDLEITVVMVTHELDIANFAKRRVVMRDGLILTDERSQARIRAAQALAKLDAEQGVVRPS